MYFLDSKNKKKPVKSAPAIAKQPPVKVDSKVPSPSTQPENEQTIIGPKTDVSAPEKSCDILDIWNLIFWPCPPPTNTTEESHGPSKPDQKASVPAPVPRAVAPSRPVPVTPRFAKAFKKEASQNINGSKSTENGKHKTDKAKTTADKQATGDDEDVHTKVFYMVLSFAV